MKDKVSFGMGYSMYAVIRIKGRVSVRKDVEDTLHMFRLNRKNHCVLLKESDSTKGMLHKIKDLITWGEISDETLRMLIEKRARKKGNKRIEKEEIELVAKEISEGKVKMVKPVFRLTPPSKGFKKSIKQHFPNGELGYRGEKINELLKRMI